VLPKSANASAQIFSLYDSAKALQPAHERAYQAAVIMCLRCFNSSLRFEGAASPHESKECLPSIGPGAAGALDGTVLHWAAAPGQHRRWAGVPGGWQTDPADTRDAGAAGHWWLLQPGTVPGMCLCAASKPNSDISQEPFVDRAFQRALLTHLLSNLRGKRELLAS
jgi:hypothetical protein